MEGEGGEAHLCSVATINVFSETMAIMHHFQPAMSWLCITSSRPWAGRELLQTPVIYTHHYQHKLAQGYKIYNSTTSEILPSRVRYQITHSFHTGMFCVFVHVQTEVQASGGRPARLPIDLFTPENHKVCTECHNPPSDSLIRKKIRPLVIQYLG